MAKVSDDQNAEDVSHRFHVTVERRQVDQFSKVVSRNSGKETAPSLRVPLTFPATWYGLNEVQSSITETVDQAIGPEQYVLLHLEQTVEMLGQLEVDKTYTLDIQVGALSKDRKFKVSAKVTDMQGVPLASMTSLFAVLNSQEKQP
jgi:hypothetical protein